MPNSMTSSVFVSRPVVSTSKRTPDLNLLVCWDRRNNVTRHQTTQDPIVARFLQRLRHLRKVLGRVVVHVLALSGRSETVWVMGTPEMTQPARSDCRSCARRLKLSSLHDKVWLPARL